VASVASATFALASSLASGHETEDAAGPLPLLTPTIVEYRWTFLAPQWIVEARKYDTRVFVPTTRPKRIEYDVLDFEFESRTIGRVPEFSCKYLDWTLPDECTTTWRNVVVEVPVPVKRHDYFEVDVLDGSWQDRQVTIDVPRLVWKEERLLVSLPALAVRAPPSP